MSLGGCIKARREAEQEGVRTVCRTKTLGQQYRITQLPDRLLPKRPGDGSSVQQLQLTQVDTSC